MIRLNADEIRCILAELMNYMDFFERVSKLNNCNDCGKKNTCEYLPEYGGTTRINCPLWEDRNWLQLKHQCKNCKFYIYDPQSGWRTCDHPEQRKIRLLRQEDETCNDWERRG